MRVLARVHALTGLALMLAGCASSGGGSSSGHTSTITLPGGGTIDLDTRTGDYGTPHGMGAFEDPAKAVAALRPRVAELLKAGDDPAVALERVTVMSQFANALYNRYQQAQDVAFLRESVDFGKKTVAECDRLDSQNIITGISMPLISARSEQEVNLRTRAPELARGGSF